VSYNSAKRVDYWFNPEQIWDAHVHAFTYKGLEKRAKAQGHESVEAMLEVFKSRTKLDWVIPPKKVEDHVKLWIDELEKHQVNKALIMSDWNDDAFLKTSIQDYPDRIIPYLMLNPKDENSLKVLEDAISKYAIKGFKLYPPLHYYHAYEDFLIPFYEIAQDHDLIITYHMGISVGAQADLRYMNPADVSPIARDYPKVDFLFAHFGTGYLKELLFLMYHVNNVYAESSSSNRWMEFLPYDITLQEVFKKVINAQGTSHIIFGTDSSSFPRGWRQPIYDWQLAVCNEIGLNQEDIDKIFWQNLKRVTNL
jgi:uncharacterized protein